MREGIGPAFHACRPERRYPVRVGLNLRFGGAQIVAVKINAGGRGRKGTVGRAELFKDKRLVSAVSDHRVGSAGQEIARVSLVSDARQGLIVDPFALQHRGDLVASRRIHERSATQIRHAADVCPTRDQDDGRGTLEYGGQHDQPAPRSPVTQNAGAADPEICLAAGNRFSDVDSRTALADGDVETRVAVEALFKCLVIAGELKLMLPFELQGHCIERGSWMRCRQKQGSPGDQPSQQGQFWPDWRWLYFLRHARLPSGPNHLSEF